MTTTKEDVAALFGNRVIDQDSWTIAELCKESPVGIAQTTAKVKDAVEAGEWEQVWKRNPNGRMVQAFRVKK